MSDLFKKRGTTFTYFLDSEEKNFVLIRVHLLEDGQTIESFALAQFSFINGKKHEIVRFDAGCRETVHVHRWYAKARPKQFIGKPATWETLIELEEEIRQKWRQYLFLYKEKKGL